MAIQIYGYAGSTCCGRVLLTLFEKNVDDYEIFHVDLYKREHKSLEFLKHQPFGETPYVIDGELTLFESRAIARTFASKYADQGTALYGSTPQEEALVEQWLEVEAQHYDSAISKIVYNLLFYPKFGLPCDHGVVANQMAKFEAVLDVYDKRLSESKYLAGDFFSLADLSHITDTHYFIHIAHKGAVFDSRPHVKAWIADLFARPTTQKWLKVGGHIP
ncbi:hypothetical protein Mapa_001338 [Marchantia paleacea]|nr:hypothetical protein Mapa_001338 [Marchantia paleacea]